MSLENDNKTNSVNGYVPLIVLADKYGYAKDHVGWLARTGRLQAIRHGRYGQWYVKEDSLKRYQVELAESQKRRIDQYVQSAKRPAVLVNQVDNSQVTKLPVVPVAQQYDKETVPSTETYRQPAFSGADGTSPQPVLYNDQSSLSAEAEELITKRINTVLATLLLLGGIFIFAYASPRTFDAFADTTKDAVQMAVNKIKDFGDATKKLATGLFDSNREGNTPNLNSPIAIETPQLSVSQSPVVTKEIIETVQRVEKQVTVIEKLSDKQLADIFLSISETKLRLANVENDVIYLKGRPITSSTNVPTIIQLPATNTSGIGSITMNPQKVDTETLSVSSSATLSSLDVTNNATISGTLTVSGATTFSGSSSTSASFELTSSSSRLGINPGNVTNTTFEVGGTASISGSLTLNNVTYTFPSSDGSSGQFLKTNGTGSLSWADAKSSNSLDFDEIVNTMLLDSDLTINRGGFFIGVGSAPSTVFEVQGTASASYFLTGNTIQVGGYTSAAYSRFGTGTSSELHYITNSSDLYITGDLEVDASVSFSGPASISNTLYISTLGKIGNVGIGTSAPRTLFQVGSGTENPFHSGGILAITAGPIGVSARETNGSSEIGILASNSIGFMGTWTNHSLRLRTNNADRVTIDTSGNVGIGTTGPTTTFQVSSLNGAVDNVNPSTGPLISVSDALAANVGGRISFGAKVNTGGDVRVTGSIAGRRENATSDNYSGYLQLATTTSGGTVTERMRIDSTGNIQFNQNSVISRNTSDGSDSGWLTLAGGGGGGGSGLDNTRGGWINVIGAEANGTFGFTGVDISMGNGTTPKFVVRNASGTNSLELDSAGALTMGVTNTNVGASTLCWDGSGLSIWGGCTSLAKYKKGVSDLSIGLDTIRQLRPVEFDWNHDLIGAEGHDLGFIAEEVEAVNPLLAEHGGDGGALSGVKYNLMTSLLTKGVQELDANIASQSAVLEDLSFRIDELESAIASQNQDFTPSSDSINNNLVFTAVTSMFKDVFNIVWEQGMLKVANIVTDKITAKEITTDKICVGITCVTEQELKALLQQAGTPTSQGSSGSSETPSPTTTPEITPEPNGE